jgi:hypothetical protein
MDLRYETVYNELVKYYPIGIREASPEYYQYPGLKTLFRVCEEKLNNSMEVTKWDDFVESLGLEMGDISTETERGSFRYSFGGRLMLLEEKFSAGFFRRELCFQLSFLAPYCTVFGMDSVEIALNNKLSCYFDPIIFVSAYSVYEQSFNLVRRRLETEFDATFIHPVLLRMKVPDLSIVGPHLSDDGNASIFQAFFGQKDLFNIYKCVGWSKGGNASEAAKEYSIK